MFGDPFAGLELAAFRDRVLDMSAEAGSSGGQAEAAAGERRWPVSSDAAGVRAARARCRRRWRVARSGWSMTRGCRCSVCVSYAILSILHVVGKL